MQHKIGLVTPPTHSHRTSEETIALGYLASILREAGYEVVVIDGWLQKLSAHQIVEQLTNGGSPSLIGMSCYRSNLEQAEEVLKRSHEVLGPIPTLCGGYGPTFHDKAFLDSGFSVAVRGEAEEIILRLVDALLQGASLDHIPSLSFKRGDEIVRTNHGGPVFDLDALPHPARDTIDAAMECKNFIHVSTSRGCEAHCVFCSIFAFELQASPHHRWRQRSIKSIVDEVKKLYETYGIRHIKFVDDSFIEPPRDEAWADAFAAEMHKYNLPIKFRTQVRADRLSPTLVRSLREAGWFSTSVGIENASPNALRRMGKVASPEENEKALAWLKENGVYVQMGMILFDPYTTLSELYENLSFLKQHDWVITKGIFTEMFAAEGTPFTNKLKRNGMLTYAPGTQNYVYHVQDAQVRRVYHILKQWQRSHARTHDWIVDSLAAPNVLADVDYEQVHLLCKQLLTLDLAFFEKALSFVECADTNDERFVYSAIKQSRHIYEALEREIATIYRRNMLTYDGIVNPYLDLSSDTQQQE